MEEAKRFFENRFTNMITSEIVEYGFTPTENYAYELSLGKGLTSFIIYGVTIVDTETGDIIHHKSRPFRSLKQAKNYISSL